MAEIKVNVELGALDTLSKLLGVFDENLNIISRETGVTAYVEGTKITLSGEENRVLLAETVINKLAGIIRSGEPIDKTRIIYCVELAKEGNAEGIEKVMSGVIAITSRGKQIKCKTVGQKKYVDAIKKNTVVFGVGPAGTGKTYLAVAMAVSAFKNKEVEKISHKARRGSGRKTRFSAGRSANQSRPLSSSFIRRSSGNVRRG